MQAFNDNMRSAEWTMYHLCNYGHINLIYIVDDLYVWDVVTHRLDIYRLNFAANDN